METVYLSRLRESAGVVCCDHVTRKGSVRIPEREQPPNETIFFARCDYFGFFFPKSRNVAVTNEKRRIGFSRMYDNANPCPNN
jgi:hypothetical protein